MRFIIVMKITLMKILFCDNELRIVSYHHYDDYYYCIAVIRIILQFAKKKETAEHKKLLKA